MTKTKLPANLVKHTSKNPIQKLLINNFYASLTSMIKDLSPNTILDAGCGEGFTMNKLKENGLGNKIEGIEYEKDAIAFGKKLFPNLIIRQGSIYELPYEDNSFDLVICTEVLEHLEEPEKAFREMLRVTKKYLMISTPNEPFFMLSNFLRGKNISRFGNDAGHVNHWNPFGLKKMLEKNGLKIKKLKFPFPWTIAMGIKQ
jgi:2-polyprenyl-3-methyl-5-hydroxy-6-metoxy-1,4-benzoquinol methylase